MTGWAELDAELDRWAAAGRRAALWWRDDDATALSAALNRLLALRRQHDLPLALAVIPAHAGRALADRLAGEAQIAVLQHGYAHVNHAPAGAKKCELTDARPLAQIWAELAEGRARLADWNGFLPVMVPPWNRIAPPLIAQLPAQGYLGLSGFGSGLKSADGLRIVDTHIDPIAWRGDRGFVGLEPALQAAIAALEHRRTGTPGPDEPTGLLTHHAVHDESIWSFVAEFLTRTRKHPGARWMSARALFGVAR